jgi:WD40 repeat protein
MRFLNARMRVVDQVHFSHEGRRLFAAGSNVPDLRYKPDNRGIDVWDLAGGAGPADRLFAEEIVAGLAVNPASGWLYVSTGYDYPDQSRSSYFAHDTAAGKSTRLGLTGGNSFVLSVHPSGRWFVAAGYDNDWRANHLVRWRQPPARPPVREWDRKQRGGQYVSNLACDPAGARVVTQDGQGGRMVVEQVYELSVRDPAGGAVRERVPIPGRTVHELRFSADGKWLVVRAGPSLIVWDAGDLREKPRKLRGGRGNLTAMSFHPSGRFLAATSNDHSVKLFDTESWELAKTYTWDIGRMRSIAFSPDGTLAAAGSDTGKVVVWDVDL